MITVIIVMTVGIILGMFFSNLPKMLKAVDKLISYAIYLLLFLLGISVGINKKIINNLDSIGVTALGITLGAIVGSVLVCWGLYTFVFKTHVQKRLSDEK